MFELTKQERHVILFLITLALIGAGVDFFVKKYSPVKTMASFNSDIGKINLNSADKNLLMTLPGIGEKLAQRIIEYRKEQTGFTELEELKNIKGITDYRYEKLKGHLIIKQ